MATPSCSTVVPVATPARSTALVHVPSAETNAPEHDDSQQPPVQAKAQPELQCKSESDPKPEETLPNGMTRRKAIISFLVVKLAKNQCG